MGAEHPMLHASSEKTKRGRGGKVPKFHTRTQPNGCQSGIARREKKGCSTWSLEKGTVWGSSLYHHFRYLGGNETLKGTVRTFAKHGRHVKVCKWNQNFDGYCSQLSACVLRPLFTTGILGGGRSPPHTPVSQAVQNPSMKYCWWKKSCTSWKVVGSLSHYLQGFIHHRWLFGSSSIYSMSNE